MKWCFSVLTKYGKKYATGMVFPLLIILIWQIAASFGNLNAYLLPAPISIGDSAGELVVNGTLFTHLGSSLIRLGEGMGLTILLAIPIGMIIGASPRVYRWVAPTLTFLQQIPAIAWIPVFILWFGIGEQSKVALIFYASFFPVFLNTVHGVIQVDPQLREVARSFTLKRSELIMRVYLPSAAPFIFVGIRLGLSNCWKVLVAAEIIASSHGIGYLLVESRNLAQPERMFVSIFVIGITGYLLDQIIQKLQQNLLPWQKQITDRGSQ